MNTDYCEISELHSGPDGPQGTPAQIQGGQVSCHNLTVCLIQNVVCTLKKDTLAQLQKSKGTIRMHLLKHI